MWQNITHTVSAMNILSLPEFLDFVRKYPKISLHLNILADPNTLSYTRVPRAAILQALKNCNSSGIRFSGANIEQLMDMNYDQKPSSDLIDYLDKIDVIRKQHWRSALPRLSAAI